MRKSVLNFIVLAVLYSCQRLPAQESGVEMKGVPAGNVPSVTRAGLLGDSGIKAGGGIITNLATSGSFRLSTVTNSTPLMIMSTNINYVTYTGTYSFAYITWVGEVFPGIYPAYTNQYGKVLTVYGNIYMVTDIEDHNPYSSYYIISEDAGATWGGGGDVNSLSSTGTPSVQFADYYINGRKVENLMIQPDGSAVTYFIIDGILVAVY
jgi:hypothetical protein